jgi:primosomal protein N' (replication factor Y)
VGKRKVYAGIVIGVRPYRPQQESLRPVTELLDEYPILTPHQIALFGWMAAYYACTPGEVVRAAVPSGFKLDSELVVRAVGTPDPDLPGLPDDAVLLFEALATQEGLTVDEAGDVLGTSSPMKRLKALETLGLIVLEPFVAERFRPKIIRCLRPSSAYETETQLAEALDALGRAPQQHQVLLRVAEAFLKGTLAPEADVRRQAQASPAAVAALVKKGILQVVEIATDRVGEASFKPKPQDFPPTPPQAQALEDIRGQWVNNPTKPVLLHGVTGSGKTWVYIQLMAEALQAGKQVLYLLPEISLTKQAIDRLRTAFGDGVGVYNSRFSEAERVEIWNHCLQGRYPVVVGARSALFLPLRHLGLIIVDEEHDGSFKQQDPAPRYNARDCALWLGAHLGIPVLLGSATPSLETFHNAQLGKFGLASLPAPAVAATPAQVTVVNMSQAVRERNSQGEFSQYLLDALHETLAKGEQAIVFKNRRGYAPYLHCTQCGHVPNCVQCDISLTFHKRENYVRCHYCGYTDTNVHVCSNCGYTELTPQGQGTERLEEHLQALLPQARIERMDQDTMRGKYAFARLIDRFEAHDVDILVGTQMVTKGLDFERVTLVAVTDADRLFHWPDFRAHETALQLLKQFAGRAGRSSRPSQVVIQTYAPDHPVILLLQQPYEVFFQHELPHRQHAGYPPFTRLIRLEMRNKSRDFLEIESNRFISLLRPTFLHNVLGPESPQVQRVRGLYRMNALVKVGLAQSPAKAKKAIEDAITRYYQSAPAKTLRILVDVDPR